MAEEIAPAWQCLIEVGTHAATVKFESGVSMGSGHGRVPRILTELVCAATGDDSWYISDVYDEPALTFCLQRGIGS